MKIDAFFLDELENAVPLLLGARHPRVTAMGAPALTLEKSCFVAEGLAQKFPERLERSRLFRLGAGFRYLDKLGIGALDLAFGKSGL